MRIIWIYPNPSPLPPCLQYNAMKLQLCKGWNRYPSPPIMGSLLLLVLVPRNPMTASNHYFFPSLKSTLLCYAIRIPVSNSEAKCKFKPLSHTFPLYLSSNLHLGNVTLLQVLKVCPISGFECLNNTVLINGYYFFKYWFHFIKSLTKIIKCSLYGIFKSPNPDPDPSSQTQHTGKPV
jgi:hypothetical protein